MSDYLSDGITVAENTMQTLAKKAAMFFAALAIVGSVIIGIAVTMGPPF